MTTQVSEAEGRAATGVACPGITMHRKPLSRWRELSLFSNVLTLARIILTPVFVWMFVSDSWYMKLLGFIVFVVAAITDWWDGHHARKNMTVTSMGKFLDPLADKLLTITAMVTLALESLIPLWMVCVIFARDFTLTWMRVQASNQGRKFTTLRLAKWKTAVQLTAIIAIIGMWTLRSVGIAFDFHASLIPDDLLVGFFTTLIAVTLILAVVSGGQYLLKPAIAPAADDDTPRS